MKEKYYYDLHCHTLVSFDSPTKIKEIVKVAKQRGLDGVAITDHNKTYKGPLKIDGIDIIPGCEITTKNNEHLLAYFINEDPPEKMNPEEIFSFVKKQGGYSSLAHPFREGYEWFKNSQKSLEMTDGLESGNASDSEEKRSLARKIKKENSDILLFETAGSDAHMAGQIGFAVVETDQKITKENFKKTLLNSSIIVRPEAEDFRKESSSLKNIVEKLGNFLKIYNLKIFRKLFFIFIVRNYFRIKNLGLKRIKFNYKK